MLVRSGMVVTSLTGVVVASDPHGSYILVPKDPLGTAASVDVFVGGAHAPALVGRVAARAPSNLNAALITVDEPRLPPLSAALGRVAPGQPVALATLSTGSRVHVRVETATVDAVAPASSTFTLARGSRGGPSAAVVDATGSVVGLASSAEVGAPTTAIDLAGLRDFLVSAGVPLAPRTAQR
ncbi:MAG: hypothetical protein ACLPYS_09845 [Vulcanimicrobiaceae bacterium]